MDVETELEVLCEYVKQLDIRADLDLNGSILFMQGLIRNFPYFHSVISEDFEERVLKEQDVSDITDHFLIPNDQKTIKSLYCHLLIEAVNEQVSDCINMNEINEPIEPELDCMTEFKRDREKQLLIKHQHSAWVSSDATKNYGV